MAKQVERVYLENVKLSFANIFEAKGFNGGEPRFSASFLISKDDKDNLALLQAAMDKVAAVEWPKNPPKLKEAQLCLRDGDNESWKGYAEHFYVTSSNGVSYPPKIQDLDGTNLRVNPDDKPQSGDIVNAVVEIWAQDNNFGKRLNARLMGVQFVKQGERFSKASDDIFPVKTEELRTTTAFKGGAFKPVMAKKVEEIDEDNPFK